MTRALILRLLVVLSLLGAGLHSTTAGGPGHAASVDLTFPTAPNATFSDDYARGRGGGRVHQATDLFAPMGTPVYAAVGGRVVWAPDRHASAGYALQVRGDDGRVYAYYHLGPHAGSQAQAYAPGIVAGATVARGQHIGFLGDSGNAAGGRPHLHFEIHDDRVTDPTGSNRMNPFASLTAAIRRGDVPGRIAAPAASRDGSRETLLRSGDRGPAVASWQAVLNAAAGAALVTDGIFGPATDRATRDFQRARGLVVDGVVGPASRTAASAATVTTGSASSPTPITDEGAILRPGDRGPAVATWQGQLNRAAGAGLAPDGIFGPATEEATRRFQQSRGITVDGVVGPQSRRAVSR